MLLIFINKSYMENSIVAVVVLVAAAVAIRATNEAKQRKQ